MIFNQTLQKKKNDKDAIQVPSVRLFLSHTVGVMHLSANMGILFLMVVTKINSLMHYLHGPFKTSLWFSDKFLCDTIQMPTFSLN